MNEKSNKSISSALGIPPIPTPTIEKKKNSLAEISQEAQLPIVAPPTEPQNDVVEDDYSFARNNLRTIITKGNDLMDTLTSIAEESESPRSFEVLAAMMKNVIEANQTLMNLSKTKKDIGRKGVDLPDGISIPASQGGQNIQTAVFVGSTADLDAFIASQTKRISDDSRIERDITPGNTSPK